MSTRIGKLISLCWSTIGQNCISMMTTTTNAKTGGRSSDMYLFPKAKISAYLFCERSIFCENGITNIVPRIYNIHVVRSTWFMNEKRENPTSSKAIQYV